MWCQLDELVPKWGWILSWLQPTFCHWRRQKVWPKVKSDLGLPSSLLANWPTSPTRKYLLFPVAVSFIQHGPPHIQYTSNVWQWRACSCNIVFCISLCVQCFFFLPNNSILKEQNSCVWKREICRGLKSAPKLEDMRPNLGPGIKGLHWERQCICGHKVALND